MMLHNRASPLDLGRSGQVFVDLDHDKKHAAMVIVLGDKYIRVPLEPKQAVSLARSLNEVAHAANVLRLQHTKVEVERVR